MLIILRRDEPGYLYFLFLTEQFLMDGEKKKNYDFTPIFGYYVHRFLATIDRNNVFIKKKIQCKRYGMLWT